VLDYLLALLKALIDSFMTLFSRVPALDWFKEWFGGTFKAFGSLTGILVISLAAVLGALSVVLFFWILSRRPGQDRRDLDRMVDLPFDPVPDPRPKERGREP
jgi:hypothetical protein